MSDESLLGADDITRSSQDARTQLVQLSDLGHDDVQVAVRAAINALAEVSRCAEIARQRERITAAESQIEYSRQLLAALGVTDV